MVFKEKYLKKIDYIFLILSFFIFFLMALILKNHLQLTFSIFLILSIILLEFIILQIYRRLAKHFEYLIESKIFEDLKDKISILSYDILINNLKLNTPLSYSK